MSITYEESEQPIARRKVFDKDGKLVACLVLFPNNRIGIAGSANQFFRDELTLEFPVETAPV